MITFVLTNRNRDLRIIKNCFDSLVSQTDQNFEWYVVDYGSEPSYLVGLKDLVSKYPKIKLLLCPVHKQIWNKSRAINIVLKETFSPSFFVGDIDMIYHPNFISTLSKLGSEGQATYFRVGFLNVEESRHTKKFDEYKPAFLSDAKATGMTLYPTQLLKAINGFDEFFHGWGSEDTDAHIRLSNSGCPVLFYDKDILMLHQWHPKAYRNKLSNRTFHTALEKINAEYLSITSKNKTIKANLGEQWGIAPDIKEYEKLNFPDLMLEIDSQQAPILAVLSQFKNLKGMVISLEVEDANPVFQLKQSIKKMFRKKHIHFLDMETINNMILDEIVRHYRNCPYEFSFDQPNKKIYLKIKL